MVKMTSLLKECDLRILISNSQQESVGLEISDLPLIEISSNEKITVSIEAYPRLSVKEQKWSRLLRTIFNLVVAVLYLEVRH